MVKTSLPTGGFEMTIVASPFLSEEALLGPLLKAKPRVLFLWGHFRSVSEINRQSAKNCLGAGRKFV
jgi:hypothetical protein